MLSLSTSGSTQAKCFLPLTDFGVGADISVIAVMPSRSATDGEWRMEHHSVVYSTCCNVEADAALRTTISCWTRQKQLDTPTGVNHADNDLHMRRLCCLFGFE